MNMILNKYCPIIILLIVSIITVSPHIYIGFPIGHSNSYNFLWQEHFTDQLLAGEFLPRWLFNYFDGYGAPVFYFYAPLPFYLYSIVDVVLVPDSDRYTIFTLSYMIVFFLSGAAFYIFISRYTDKYWAIVLSSLYIIAPYHYLDIEVRAAIGESFTYIWLPLIMYWLCRPNQKRTDILFAGVCYAGLIISHLPSALLCSLPIAIFMFFMADSTSKLQAIYSASLVGLVGAGLSAFYIIPAMLLQNTLPHDAWVTASGADFLVVNRLLGNENGLSNFDIKVYYGLAAISLGSLVTACCCRFFTLYTARLKLESQAVRLITACAVCLVVCWFLMSSLSRIIWETFPILSTVQFPWRLGVIIEFCSVLLFGLTAPVILDILLSLINKKTNLIYIFIRTFIIIGVAVLGVGVVITLFPQTLDSTYKGKRMKHLSPTEYRPIWFVKSSNYLPAEDVEKLDNINHSQKVHYDGITHWRSIANNLQPIMPMRQLEKEESVKIDDSSVISSFIQVNLTTSATILIRKLFYPHWKLTDSTGNDIRVYPDKNTGLILADLPAGIHRLSLSRRTLLPEIIGTLVSVLTFIAVSISILIYRKKTI